MGSFLLRARGYISYGRLQIKVEQAPACSICQHPLRQDAPPKTQPPGFRHTKYGGTKAAQVARFLIRMSEAYGNFELGSDTKLLSRLSDMDVGIELFKRDGVWYGRDKHGEFRMDRGTTQPPDPDDYDYIPCGAVVKFTFERYGEKRYCEGMAAKNFGNSERPYPEFCKHHQVRGALMEHVEDSFKTGAFAKSYETIFQFLPPHKQVIAVEVFEDLMDESKYNYEPDIIPRTIDTEEWPEAPDEIEVAFPVPTKHRARGQALWFASLDFVRMQNIHEEQFRVAFEDDVAVGEKEFEKETESGYVIEIKDEHHLNLPLSRIQKDYESHLKFGGVDTDDESEGADMRKTVWVSEVSPKSAEPEAKSDGPESGFADIDEPET